MTNIVEIPECVTHAKETITIPIEQYFELLGLSNEHANRLADFRAKYDVVKAAALTSIIINVVLVASLLYCMLLLGDAASSSTCCQLAGM